MMQLACAVNKWIILVAEPLTEIVSGVEESVRESGIACRRLPVDRASIEKLMKELGRMREETKPCVGREGVTHQLWPT